MRAMKPLDFTDLIEKERERISRLVKVFGDFVDALRPKLQPIMELAEKFYAATMQAYREAGAIYGDTPEGMMRWLGELNEVARHEREIERIKQHHEMLADFRRQLTHKRDRAH